MVDVLVKIPKIEALKYFSEAASYDRPTLALLATFLRGPFVSEFRFDGLLLHGAGKMVQF